MPTKLKAGFVGAIIVVMVLALQAVEHWTMVDAVLSGLKEKGSAGIFIVGILMSRILPLVIALAAIYLVFEGRRERKHEDSTVHDEVPVRAESRISDSGNATAFGGNATARIGDIHIHPPPSSHPAASVTKEDSDLPILEFTNFKTLNVAAGLLRNEDVGASVLMAEFCNPLRELKRETPTAYKVLAQLTFRFDKEHEISIPSGHWLLNYQKFAQFDPGIRRLLIVALSVSGDIFYTLRNNNSVDPRTRRWRSGMTILRAPVTVPFLGRPDSVEIALVADGMALFKHEFLITQESDGPMQLS